MELNILIGAGLGALAGPVLTGIYAGWPTGEISPQNAVKCRSCKSVLRSGWSAPLLWLLRHPGRCQACGVRIDPLLPGIELLAVAIGAIAAGWFADPVTAIAAALLGWQLLLLAALDLTCRWLPNSLNLMLAATGLGLAAVLEPYALPDLLLGLVAGYVSLEGVRRGYRRLRGREGLGGGDPKLFAAIGCWFGWQWLPWIMVLAALGGLVAVVALTLVGRRPHAAAPLPLGTMLAVTAWPLWLISHAN